MGAVSAKTVRVAIVGVGNCASSLVQGLEYYKDADDDARVPGLMHVRFGDYHIPTSRSSPRSTWTPRRSAVDLSEAIFASENNTIKIADVPPTGVTVQRGPTLDGLGEYYRGDHHRVRRAGRGRGRRRCARPAPTCWCPTCRWAPRQADKFYAQCAIDAERRVRQRAAGVHRLRPGVGGEVHRGRRADRRRRHQVPGRRDHHAPRPGQAVRGPRRGAAAHLPAQRRRQHGLHEHAGAQRLESKKISKTQAVTSQIPHEMAKADVHIGPSDHVPWLDDRKLALRPAGGPRRSATCR